MIGLTLLFLSILTLRTFPIALGSSVKCLMFTTEEDIFASLPFMVSIHPQYKPEFGNYASFGIESWSGIVELQLYNVDSIPLPIFCLRNLKTLVIKEGNATIPPEIGQLTYLKSLSISRKNQSSTNSTALVLPSELFSLTSLETIILDNYGLETLPEAIGQLKNLKQINLTSNRLESLPNNISQLKQLQSFDVSNNPSLTSLDVLNGMSSLTVIATNCSIDHLPQNLTSIGEFNLSNNKLTTLNGIETFTGKTNPLNNQPISTYSFNNNQIYSFPASIGKLNAITFEVNNNKLTTLPAYIFTTQGFTNVDVRNNMFSDRKCEWIAGRARGYYKHWQV